LLAAVGAVATLLIWLNFTARVTLIVAAWTADPPERPAPDRASLVNVDHTPNYVSVSAPETLQWEHDSYTGIIAIDQDRPADPDEDEAAPDGGQAPEHAQQPERWGGLIGVIRSRRENRRAARATEKAGE